jgi:hypothetical protein
MLLQMVRAVVLVLLVGLALSVAAQDPTDHSSKLAGDTGE